MDRGVVIIGVCVLCTSDILQVEMSLEVEKDYRLRWVQTDYARFFVLSIEWIHLKLPLILVIWLKFFFVHIIIPSQAIL